jgi:hypothetical protein
MERQILESVMLQESSLMQNPNKMMRLHKSEMSVNQKTNALAIDDDDDELLLEELNYEDGLSSDFIIGEKLF